jgi:L-amino acid N-acyltransferase YncA
MDITTLPQPIRRRRRPWRRTVEPARPALRVRPLTAGDGVTLDAVFDGLSERSRYLRFHGPVPRLTARVRASLLDIDGHRHVAVVAEAWSAGAWAPVGIARAIRTGPGVAELAVEVVDDWQGQGVGRLLLEDLRERAAALGYRELHAEVLLSNAGVLALLHRVFPGAWLRSAVDGEATVVCPIGGAERALDAIAAAFDDLFAA